MLYWITRPVSVPHVVGSHALTKSGFRKGAPISRVLTDGTSIYFLEDRLSYTALMQVRLRHGEVSEVATVSGLTDISKDRSELLLFGLNAKTNQYDTWVQPLPGGPARLIVKNARWPAWTADGRGILFARNHDTELFRVNADGTDPRRIATLPDITTGIGASPDGVRIRVGVNFGANFDILELDSSGSKPRRILQDVQRDLLVGTWSPDAKFFFFVAWNTDRNDLWVLPEKQHWWQFAKVHPVQLTFGPVSIGTPTISEDGKVIYAAGLERHGELSAYEYKSGQFVPYLSGISACYVDFSRDRQWVTYVSYPEGTLWRSRIDGSERRQLTLPGLGVVNPRWSPDGKLIAFWDISGVASRDADRNNWRIYVVSADGGGPLLLVEGNGVHDPAWSPDGNSLAYGSGPVGSNSIRLLDLKTHTSTELPGAHGLYSPRWSPDGRYLAALERDKPAKKLMIYSFTTRQWEELAFGAFAWPSWSHDSKYIFVFDNFSIVRIALGTRKKEQVVPLHGIRTTSYYFDRLGIGWFGLTPDDRPLTTRDTGIEEIHAFDLEYK